LFAQAGNVVSVALIKERDTGRSKGFAFVEMGSQSEAEQAIKLFNGTSLDDRSIKVDLARPPQDRGDRPFKSRSGQGDYRDRKPRSGGTGGRRY
jgi:RNA recognition motif-containing protein